MGAATGIAGAAMSQIAATAQLPVTSLFAAGEKGLWLDASDIGSMYQDATGLTPVTALGQPVGLWLDKSLGFARKEMFLGAGQGQAIDASTWTLGTNVTNPNGQLVLDNAPVNVSGGGGNGLNVTFSTTTITAGKWYMLRIANTAMSTGGGSCSFMAIAGTTNNTVGTVFYLSAKASSRVEFFQATATGRLGFSVRGGVSSGTFTELSVAEISPTYVTQATASARPVLQIDSGGRYYLYFDGTDDNMSTTGNVGMTTTGLSFVAGLRKLDDSARRTFWNMGTTNGQGVALFTPGANLNNYAIRVQNTATANYGDTVTSFITSPNTSVVSGTVDCTATTAADQIKMRVNAVSNGFPQFIPNMTAFTDNPIWIGRAQGTVFSGYFYGLVIRGALSTVAQLAAVESYMNTKTGAY